MGDTKDEIYKQVNALYEKIDTKQAWGIWFVLIIVSIISDILCTYKGLKIFLFSEKSTIVAIAVVIWTFTMSVFVYCLGKVDQRYYGIHVVDIFVRGLSAKKIFFVAAISFAEIVLLIVMSVFGVGVGVLVLTLFQCYMMLYVILMILQRTSGEFAISQIRGEIEETYKIEYSEKKVYYKETGILGYMLHNIDYDSYDETGILLDMLCYYNKNFEQQMNGQIGSAVKKYVNLCSKEIAKHIYVNGKEARQKVVMDWFREVEFCIEIKQGILMHMTEEWEKGYGYERLEQLLNCETKYYRELHIWVFVYNIYLQEFEGEAWRELYIEYLMRKIKFGIIKTDENIAIGYWEQITEDKKLYSLFKYIF